MKIRGKLFGTDNYWSNIGRNSVSEANQSIKKKWPIHIAEFTIVIAALRSIEVVLKQTSTI